MQFGQTSVNVLIMLLYALPGYILIKVKAIKPTSISAFALVLLYICQPCLSVYSFQKVLYSAELVKNMGIFMGISTALQIIVLGIAYLLLHKKYSDASYRVCTVATAFGNIGFLGVPLLEALLPGYPEAIAYSAAFIVSMNIISWTLGAYIMTGNRKYVSFKKVFFTPPIITLFVSLPLFFTKTALPTPLMNAVTVLAKMTAPMCMLILGMRFATVDKKEMFSDVKVFITAGIKIVIFPLLGFLATHWLPIDYCMKATMFILCCCPTASVILNLSEIFGSGQKIAANIVLVSTLFSMLTIPLLLLIL